MNESPRLKNIADRDELEVMDALRGATDLRDRLLVTLSAGTPSVADLAYALKVRVKEDYKILQKISKKRDERPDYGVKDVTDLVGLRIITLYRLDAMEIIPALLDLIKADLSETGVFVADSIREVFIYSTNPKGDAQKLPDRVLALFRANELGKIAAIKERPENYTSIHIVLQGRGKYRDSYRSIPIEIQVRTAFEDVWGEIDHALKYKREQAQALERSSSRDEDRLFTSLAHLNVLKTMIDGIAQYADQIKLQLDELDGRRMRYSTSKVAEDASARLASLPDLPADLRDDILRAVSESRPYTDGTADTDTLERVERLRASITDLANVERAVDATEGLRPKTSREARFVIRMELALVHFHLGNLLEDGSAQLKQAVDIYTSLETTFPDRLVVQYRFARVLDAMGSRSEAIEKLRSVVRRLNAKGESTPRDHWIRSAAPRLLGVLLWEEAQSVRRREDAPGETPSRVLDLLKQAYVQTLVAHDVQVFDDPLAAAEPSEKAKAANNLLYFSLEYFGAGGEPDADARLTVDEVQRYLDELNAAKPAKLTDIHVVDTVRRGYRYLGDVGRERAASNRLLKLAKELPVEQISGAIWDEAFREAKACVEASAGAEPKRKRSRKRKKKDDPALDSQGTIS